MLFQYIFEVQEHITTVFVFAVFLVSLFTTGTVTVSALPLWGPWR